MYDVFVPSNEDCAAQREFEIHINSTKAGKEQKHNYKVTIHTGDVEHAGTDDHVSIVLVGEKGATQKHKAIAWLDAAGLDGSRRAGVVRGQFLFRQINHATAEPL